MRSYQIVIDTAGELDAGMRRLYNFDTLRMSVVWNGSEQLTTADWELFSPQDLYFFLRGGRRILTGPVPPDEFSHVFKKYAALDVDVLYVATSSALSRSFETGSAVASMIMQDYPGVTVRCVDTKCAGYGAAAAAIFAARLRDAGKNLDEAAWLLENNLSRFCGWFAVAAPDHLRHSGKFRPGRASGGRLVANRSVLSFDESGALCVTEKVKGREELIPTLAERMRDAVGTAQASEIFVCHADSPEDGEALAEKVRHLIPDAAVTVWGCSPAVEAVLGAGALGVFGTVPGEPRRWTGD